MTTPIQPTAKKPQPTVAELARKNVCPECGGTPVRKSAKGPMPTYCSVECKKARGNRRLVRGAAIIEFAQAWRALRAQGPVAQASFAELNSILDQFNAEDAAWRGPNGERRPRADLCAAKILIDGTKYFDRQRKSPQRELRAAEKAAAPDLTALQAKAEDPETTDNERAILAAALEIMTAMSSD